MVFIYNALFILLIGCVFRNKLNKNRYKKMFLFICFLQMFLIQGLRSFDVGTDTAYYIDIYKNFTHKEYYSFLYTHFEPGFQLLYNLLKTFNLDAQMLLVVVSAITMFNFAYFIYKNSENTCLSVFIFACMFYPNSFNIMRQYLAVSIALLSFNFILNNNNIKAAICVLIGFSVHSTALLVLIPLILYKIKNWNLVRNLILVTGAIFFIFGNKILPWLLAKTSKSFYINSHLYDTNRYLRMTTILTLLFSILSWYFLKKNKEGKYKSQFNLYACIAFINLDCGILYLKYEFISRVIELFNLFLIISFPLALKYVRSYYKPIIKLGTILIPFLLMLNSVYNSGSGVEKYTMFFISRYH